MSRIRFIPDASALIASMVSSAISTKKLTVTGHDLFPKDWRARQGFRRQRRVHHLRWNVTRPPPISRINNSRDLRVTSRIAVRTAVFRAFVIEAKVDGSA